MCGYKLQLSQSESSSLPGCKCPAAVLRCSRKCGGLWLHWRTGDSTGALAGTVAWNAAAVPHRSGKTQTTGDTRAPVAGEDGRLKTTTTKDKHGYDKAINLRIEKKMKTNNKELSPISEQKVRDSTSQIVYIHRCSFLGWPYRVRVPEHLCL